MTPERAVEVLNAHRYLLCEWRQDRLYVIGTSQDYPPSTILLRSNFEAIAIAEKLERNG